jgi:hypothetical protein
LLTAAAGCTVICKRKAKKYLEVAI